MVPLFLGLFGGLFGGGALAVASFERSSASEIRDTLRGDHRTVQVHARTDYRILAGDLPSVTITASQFETDDLPFFTEPKRSTRGHLRRFCFQLSDFTMGSLHVARFDAIIPECRYDLGLAQRHRHFRLSRSGVGTGTVEIQTRDLEQFIAKKYRQFDSVKVSLDQGSVKVSGHGNFVIFAADFEVKGRLVPGDGTHLTLVEPEISLNGKRTDAKTEALVMQLLNPVVDLNRDLKMHGAIKVEKIEHVPGKILASGQTRIPERE